MVKMGNVQLDWRRPDLAQIQGHPPERHLRRTVRRHGLFADQRPTRARATDQHALRTPTTAACCTKASSPADSTRTWATWSTTPTTPSPRTLPSPTTRPRLFDEQRVETSTSTPSYSNCANCALEWTPPKKWITRTRILQDASVAVFARTLLLDQLALLRSGSGYAQRRQHHATF